MIKGMLHRANLRISVEAEEFPPGSTSAPSNALMIQYEDKDQSDEAPAGIQFWQFSFLSLMVLASRNFSKGKTFVDFVA